MQKVTYKGHNYLVRHLYSENTYGRRRVYHVLTNNQKWDGGILNEVVGYPQVMSKAEKDLLYKQKPTMEVAFKPYWQCEFTQDDWYQKLEPIDPKTLEEFPVDTDSYYIFTYVEPYDD